MRKISILIIIAVSLVSTVEAKVSEACKSFFDRELEKAGLNSGGVSGKFCLTKKTTNNTLVVSSPVANSSAELIEVDNGVIIEVKQEDVTGAQWTKTLFLKEQDGKCLIDRIKVDSLAGETSVLDWDTCFRLTHKKNHVEYLRLDWKPIKLQNVPVHMEYPMANLCVQYHAVDVSQFVKPVPNQKKSETPTKK